MKITHAETFVVGTEWRNLTIVRVHTDEGLTGLGEARMVNHTDALVGYLAEAVPRHLVGHDPFRIEDLVKKMGRDDFSRAGEVMSSGIAMFETACWDIVGKALDQPVYNLLGGPVRDKVKAYANGWYRVERTPEEFHAAAKKVVERGYGALKLDPFGPGHYEMEREEKLKAVALVKALKKASDGIDSAVATGERIHQRLEYREVFELQAADVIQPDISHIGGLLETKKLAAWADAYYVTIAPHNVGGQINTAAALHLAATTTNFRIQEYFNDFADPWVRETAPGLPEVVDGYFGLPKGPGLGVELNEEVVGAHPKQNVHFNLFAEGWEKRETTKAPGS